MASLCAKCGGKLPLLHLSDLCGKCKQEHHNQDLVLRETQRRHRQDRDAQVSQTVHQIVATRRVEDSQLALLNSQDHGHLLKLYNQVYKAFDSDDGLSEPELEALIRMIEGLGLSAEEVQFEERLRPYVYAALIQKGDPLPTINLQIEGGNIPVLKRGELIHYATPASLQESKTVRVGYQSGSTGVSIRVAKGVRYRVGASRGHIVKQDRVLTTSSGVLLVTNQRIFLNPTGATKPVSIPLNKILSYHVFENGLAVYKDGREKAYFFATPRSHAAEVVGMSLGYLLHQLST